MYLTSCPQIKPKIQLGTLMVTSPLVPLLDVGNIKQTSFLGFSLFPVKLAYWALVAESVGAPRTLTILVTCASYTNIFMTKTVPQFNLGLCRWRFGLKAQKSQLYTNSLPHFTGVWIRLPEKVTRNVSPKCSPGFENSGGEQPTLTQNRSGQQRCKQW